MRMRWFSWSVFSLFLSPCVLAAYLDPGTGSYIFQLLIAGLLGFLFIIKTYWSRIKGFLIRVFSGEEREKEETEHGES